MNLVVVWSNRHLQYKLQNLWHPEQLNVKAIVDLVICRQDITLLWNTFDVRFCINNRNIVLAYRAIVVTMFRGAGGGRGSDTHTRALYIQHKFSKIHNSSLWSVHSVKMKSLVSWPRQVGEGAIVSLFYLTQLNTLSNIR